MSHDMTTAEGQMAAAKARGLRCVTEISTGRQGWVTQEQNHGFHYRIRWAGAKGADAVSRVKVDEIDFHTK